VDHQAEEVAEHLAPAAIVVLATKKEELLCLSPYGIGCAVNGSKRRMNARRRPRTGLFDARCSLSGIYFGKDGVKIITAS
jgi:hypothetical protein